MVGIELLALAAVIVFAAYFLKGFTGFGPALVSVSLLSLFMDIRFVVPAVLLFDLLSGVVLMPKVHRDVNWRAFTVLVVGLLGGAAIGTYLLATWSPFFLKRVLGVLVVLFSIRLLFFPKSELVLPKRTEDAGGFGIGWVAGVFGGLFGTNGPPMIIYLAHVLKGKAVLRATLIALFFADTIFRTGLYAYAGLLNLEIVKFFGLMALPLVAGIFAGNHMHLKVSEEFFRKSVGVVLLAAGVLLVLT